MYEPRGARPLSHAAFLRRLGHHAVAACAFLLASLVLGMLGYRYFENLSWIDSFLNAAMLLGGMGPVNLPVTTAGKLFAGCYALYAGLVFLVAVAFIFTPVLHRLLHKFHWSENN